jgi:hypothetical protein
MRKIEVCETEDKSSLVLPGDHLVWRLQLNSQLEEFLEPIEEQRIRVRVRNPPCFRCLRKSFSKRIGRCHSFRIPTLTTAIFAVPGFVATRIRPPNQMTNCP